MDKYCFFSRFLTFGLFAFSSACLAQEMIGTDIQPLVMPKIFEEAKKNMNWKKAIATGQQEQIVFMNVSTTTNPKNEIGWEVHPFDQAILIVEGRAKAILNDKESTVKAGDLIFIPMGTRHNVVNLDQKKNLKLISFYSNTDIPKDAAYEKKPDEAEE